MTAFDNPAVVGRDKGGEMWSGTASWLVKETPFYDEEKCRAGIEVVTSKDYDQPLTRCEHKRLPLFVEGPMGVLRVYDRPDGKSVRIRDDYLTTVEDALQTEGDDGDLWPARYEVRQHGERLGPVGLFVKDELVAIVMPVRLINDHVLEQAGGDDEAGS